jgi:hypothetical protein
LLRGDPFALVVELLARVGAAAPGVLGSEQGLLHAEAVVGLYKLNPVADPP